MRQRASSFLSNVNIFDLFIYGLIGILALCIIGGLISIIRSESRRNRHRSYRMDIDEDTFQIVEERGSSTIVKTYSGGERYVDGHPVLSSDDMTKWFVLKGFAEGIERRIYEIEKLLLLPETENGDKLFSEWKMRYNQYRLLCIEHGNYNYLIGLKESFIPTKQQLVIEENYKRRIEKTYNEWEEKHTQFSSEKSMIVNYLNSCPRKHCLKKKLLSDLSGNEPEAKKKVLRIYKRLISLGVIGEKENNKCELEARLIIRKKKTSNGSKQYSIASRFNPALYSDVSKADIYKVEYTVSKPIELNKELNVCSFISRSSGEKYYTSLESCTCPAFSKSHCCKHMLALAIELGYFDKEQVL